MLWGQTNCSSCLIFCLLDFKLCQVIMQKHNIQQLFLPELNRHETRLRLVLNRFSCYESTRILSFKNHKKKKKTVILCWNMTNWSSRHGSTCRDCEWTLLLHLSSCSLTSDSLTWSLIVPADDCQLSLNDLHSSRLLHISKLVYIERPVIMSQISSSYSQLFLLHSHFIIISSCFCRRKQFLNFSLWGV